MKLITDCGRRLDRETELARLIALARVTPFNRLASDDRQRFKELIEWAHRQRECARFSKDHQQHLDDLLGTAQP